MGEVVDFRDERRFRELLTTLPERRSQVGDLIVAGTHGGWSLYPVADHNPDGGVWRVLVQSGVRVSLKALNARAQYFIIPAQLFADEAAARAVCWTFYLDLESLIVGVSAAMRASS